MPPRAASRVRRSPAAGDTGSVAIEYLAVSAAMLVLLGALTAGGAQRTVAYGFERLYCKLQQALGIGGGCAPLSPFDADYKPVKCKVSSSTTDVTFGVKVLIVKLGQNTTMTTVYNSDGTVDVSIANEDEAGVEVGIGAGAHVDTGEGSFRPGAKAEAGAVLTGQSQQTWQFPNADEAERFRNQLIREFAVEVTGSPLVAAANWLYDQVSGGPSLPSPTSVTEAGGGEAYADASANVPLIVEGKAGAEAGIVLSRTRGTKDGKPYTEIAVAVDLTGSASVDLFGAGVGGERTGTGVMKIRYDDQGRPTSVTFVSTQRGNFTGTLGQPNGLKDFANLKKIISAQAGGGGQEAVVVTTTVYLDTAERRELFEQWGSGLAVGGAASSAWDALWAEPGTAANAQAGEFGELLRTTGRTSVVTYDGTVLDFGGGVEGKLGVQAGVDIGVGHDTEQATSAYYLGAPDAAGAREVLALPECVAR
jgi:hypothetical protein